MYGPGDDDQAVRDAVAEVSDYWSAEFSQLYPTDGTYIPIARLGEVRHK